MFIIIKIHASLSIKTYPLWSQLSKLQLFVRLVMESSPSTSLPTALLKFLHRVRRVQPLTLGAAVRRLWTAESENSVSQLVAGNIRLSWEPRTLSRELRKLSRDIRIVESDRHFGKEVTIRSDMSSVIRPSLSRNSSYSWNIKGNKYRHHWQCTGKNSRHHAHHCIGDNGQV